MDDLPPEVAFISADPACVHFLGIVDCSLGSLGASTTIPVTITVRVSLSATGIITNTATVSTTSADLVPSNDQDQAVSTILPPDLELPTVSWTSPVSDEVPFDVGCQIVRFEVNAADNVAVYRVRFYRWDPTIGPGGDHVGIGYDYSAPFQWDFDTCILPPRWNQVWAWAQDTSGNVSTHKFIWLYRSYLQYLPVMHN
ncbi:MAG: hypothetical protein A2W33_03040 [Chloroflexi bacterium RBG_16_52_11]|nr:MAG: hypothetical protein A2W33_03040 [Chloroflexi bacterium RBG_16_52_11]